MKRIIAIVAGGDSSEHDVSMRSAQGIKSFLENQPYDTYIVEVRGTNWNAHLNDGTSRLLTAANAFVPIFLISPSTELPAKTE